MGYTVTVKKVAVNSNPNNNRRNAKEINMAPKIIEVKASSGTIKRTVVTPREMEFDGKTIRVEEVVHEYLFAGNRKPFLVLREKNDGTGTCEVLLSR